MLSAEGLNLTNDIKILFTVLLVLAALLLIYLLFRSINKERRIWNENKEKSGIVSYENFQELLSNQIQYYKKSNFTVMRIDISESASLLKNLGELQYNNALSQLINSWRLQLESSVKIALQGQDTVLILFKNKNNRQVYENICKLLINEADKSIIVAGALKVDFDINIGVVSYPEGGKTVEALNQNLQLAIVAAKRKGINQYKIYDLALSNKETEEYKNYVEIKNAIENKEFTLYYQPIVYFNTMEVFAAESLLRWKHKERGVLPPSTFLSIMEHTGDINWVGFWAMEQLFKQYLQWKNQFPDFSFILNHNLSAKQLMNPLLPDELRRLIKKYRVNTADFCLEIVEFALIDTFETVKENIQKLKQLGFKLAVDNYGGAQSSLQVLASLSVDMIKLSKNFIKESETNEMTLNIINMLISYAKKNNIKIIAEGVENEEFAEYIKNIGIEYGQGYLFQKPGGPTELMNSVILTPWNTK